MQPKLGFGLDFQTLYDRLKMSVDYGNKGKGIEAWNIIFNIIQNIGEKLDDRTDTAFHIAALFIMREGEDAKVVDKAIMEEKINDWIEEGYDALDFFQLGANLVGGLVEALQETSQNILKPETAPKR